MKLLIADTETTGVEDPEVCEVAWIEITDTLEVIHEFHTLIKPPIPIPCDAAGLHGIRDDDVEDSPAIGDVEFPDGEILLIAHNAPFDRPLIEAYMNIVNQCDTLILAKRLLQNAPNHQLQTLGCYCDLQKQLSHRAIYDCRYVLGLLEYLMEGTGWSLSQLINWSNTPCKVEIMPFGKHKGMPMDQVPKSYIRWLRSLDDLDIDMAYTLGV